MTFVTRDDAGHISVISPGVQIVLGEDIAWQIAALVTEVPGEAPDLVVLPEEHPMWDHHSGGDRHLGIPWTLPGSLTDARRTRRHVSQLKAGAFFELLLSEPGRLFTSEEIVSLLPQQFVSVSAVAGCLNGFVRPCTESGHPFPFFWWEGADDKPTRYAVRPSVAQVFLAAGE